MSSSTSKAIKLGKRALSASMWEILGRRNYVRLGRFLWMQSRLDVLNDPASNGERLVQRAFARTRTDADVTCVLDVGANVGDWTEALLSELIAARVQMRRCRFHLFEPSSPALALATNKLRQPDRGARIETHATAVSSACGRQSFYVFGDTHGSNTLRRAEGDAPGTRIEVSCTTLDHYCSGAGIERVHFAKVDTEGGDYDVLVGAQGLLKQGKIDLLQFEYNQRWIAFRYYLKDVFDLVTPFGYSVGKVTPKGIECYRTWHYELESFREGNYLIWRERLPEGLPTVKWWLDDY